MPSLLSLSRRFAGALAVLLFLGLGGCADSERFSYATETDEPNYREGQSLLKAGRRQEALAAFLKVIDKRREDSAESHLEVGLLYVQHINDPLSAIYHFRKYLSMRPNSPQAPLVRQRIDAAIREFARTLPAQPLETQGARVDLVAALDRLKQENDSLKQQLADAKANRPAALPAQPEVLAPPTRPENAPAFSLDTEPTVRTRPTSPPTRPTPSAPAATGQTPLVVTQSNPLRVAPSVSTPATARARRHIVRPGDTLSKIALEHYNDRARWRDIYAANRNVMRTETDLKVGMELRLP